MADEIGDDEDDDEARELGRQAGAAADALRAAALRLLREGEVDPRPVVLAAARVTGELAAVTALAGAGPALGPRIGPCCTYAVLPDAAKWLFALGMLAGRLEILILLMPLTRLFWRG